MLIKALDPKGGGSETWGHDIHVEIRIEGAVYTIKACGDGLEIAASTTRLSVMESRPTGRNSIAVRDIGPRNDLAADAAER